MKRFLKCYGACLFFLGLLLALCMGWPAGMVLLVVFGEHPVLSLLLAAFLLAIPVSAWRARRARAGASENPE